MNEAEAIRQRVNEIIASCDLAAHTNRWLRIDWDNVACLTAVVGKDQHGNERTVLIITGANPDAYELAHYIAHNLHSGPETIIVLQE